MVFKTLHWYIIRELLRIFVMTASALSTLAALGGTFRPLTKQGVEIGQLMTIMMYMMPAMLAYTIPMAALFAAVLVYWRLSTDNELTACRASGISFVAIVMPALILGLVVASVDLVFVNYVVPIFLEKTERAIISDIGSLLVTQVGRQENMKFRDFVIYADSAQERDSGSPNSVVVVLQGVAATKLKNGKPAQIIIAPEAVATITTSDSPDTEAEISFKLDRASAFDPRSFKRASFTVDSLFGGEKIPIPSTLKSKPKFLNHTKLSEYQHDPTNFEPVKKIIDQMATIYQYQSIGTQLYDRWKASSGGGQKPLIFQVPGNSADSLDDLYIYSPGAALDNEQQLVFSGAPGKPVRIDEYSHPPAGEKKLLYTYTCGEAALTLAPDEFSASGLAISLQLKNNVGSVDHVRQIPGFSGASKTIAGVVLPASIAPAPVPPPLDLLRIAAASTSPSMQSRNIDARKEITRLIHTIQSELHSRGSFSVSCLTLVLLGAALGILLRGKNPLAVFVVGFVPAIFLVLLITAGRQMAEGLSNRNVPIGITLIWMGNAIILALIIGVYSKLLRQ